MGKIFLSLSESVFNPKFQLENLADHLRKYKPQCHLILLVLNLNECFIEVPADCVKTSESGLHFRAATDSFINAVEHFSPCRALNVMWTCSAKKHQHWGVFQRECEVPET